MMSRTFISAAGALVVTGGLFLLMDSLVASAEMVLNEQSTKKLLEFVRLRADSQTQVKQRKMPARKRPKPPPKSPDIDPPDESSSAVGTKVAMVAPDLSAGLDLAGAFKLGAAPADREAVPVVLVQPRYPPRAEKQGIEGYAVVVFDISPTGAPENARIESSKPSGIFDREAIRAVKKMKFKPTIVDGKPQTSRNRIYRFEFQFE